MKELSLFSGAGGRLGKRAAGCLLDDKLEINE